MYYTLLVLAIPLFFILYLFQQSKSERVKKKDLIAFKSYVNKLADFEASETIVGKTSTGLFKNAFLYSQKSGEIMIVTRNGNEQFVHEDYNISELVQSEIRVNQLVVSSIQHTSMSMNRLKDLENTLSRDMGSRKNVRRMIIHLEFKTSEHTKTYEIPLINGFKPIQKDAYNQYKRDALHWQYTYGNHCIEIDSIDNTPIQLTIESIQDPLLLEDSLEFV